MKRNLCLFLLACVLFACNSNKTTDTKTETTPSTPGLDNVHGNVEDTSTTIKLNEPQPIDSSTLKDSMNR